MKASECMCVYYRVLSTVVCTIDSHHLREELCIRDVTNKCEARTG